MIYYSVIRYGDDYISHHGILGQKWGIRRYQNYDGSLTAAGKKHYRNDSKKLSEDIYARYGRAEKVVTSQVKRAIEASGSKMYGLEHRQKTKESIARKIEDDSKEKHISKEQAANEVKDALRYTSIRDNKNFVNSYFKTKDILQKLGYREISCKNYFEKYKTGEAKHKQVTSVFENAIGMKFEIQFQTPESIDAKEKKTPVYEERRRPGLSESRKAELEEQMVQLMEPVPYPDDILEIKSH